MFYYFLHCRNPSLSADGTWTPIYWPIHSPTKREVLELNANVSRVLEGHRVKKCAFWKNFLPRLLSLSKWLFLWYAIKSTEYKKFASNACGSHIKIWNLANHLKEMKQKHQTLSFQFFINKSNILMFFVLFFHVVCKISNFYMWTAKHLAQASCTELTLCI